MAYRPALRLETGDVKLGRVAGDSALSPMLAHSLASAYEARHGGGLAVTCATDGGCEVRMALSKQTVGWLKVYVLFPFAPVLIETMFRAIFFGCEAGWLAVPAYGSGLVSIMAISIFLHDALNRYRLPAPDEELVAELTGNRYTMILFFLVSCTLFSGIVLLGLVIEHNNVRDLDYPQNMLRLFSSLTACLFLRKAVLLQAQYKLSV